MKIFYSIFSYILIVIAALFGIASLSLLLMALADPSLLMNLFVIVGVVIYSITSFIFLQKGINFNAPLKPRLKDLIKVNAYVAIIFVGICIFQFIAIISNPSLLQAEPSMQVFGTTLSKTLVLKMAKIRIWFMLIYSLILGLHILQTFRYLKEYAHLFVQKTNNNSTDGSF